MVDEQVAARRLRAPLLAAGDRMTRNERDLSGQHALHAAHDVAFDAADIADDATRLEAGQKSFGQWNDGFNRRSHHQEIDSRRKFIIAEKITIDQPHSLGSAEIGFAAAEPDDLL